MNDRFKFRVWNELKQKFEPENRTHLLGNGELVLIDECGKTYVKDNPNYKVSFCTGLKDKNGNLIYEGDILKRQDGIEFPIKWNYYCYSWGGVQVADYEYNKYFEVIGNIYENPDMIEKK